MKDTDPDLERQLSALGYFDAGHSAAFARLLKDSGRVRSLVADGNLAGADFQKWKLHRFFISKAIHKDGTILDIGCGNGFLLRCLQEWSGYRLDPYGVDMQEAFIRQARRLFPAQRTHFKTRNLEVSAQVLAPGFPRKFDFIYWNVWDNFHFRKQQEIDVLKNAGDAVAQEGRLILGFYESTKDKGSKIRAIEGLGLRVSGFLRNPGGRFHRGEVIVWIDKKEGHR